MSKAGVVYVVYAVARWSSNANICMIFDLPSTCSPCVYLVYFAFPPLQAISFLDNFWLITLNTESQDFSPGVFGYISLEANKRENLPCGFQ